MLGNLDEHCSWGTRVSSPPAVRVIKSGFVKTIEIELCYHWTLDKMHPSLLFAQKRTNSYVMYSSNKMGDLKQMPSLLSHFFAKKKGSTWIKCTFHLISTEQHSIIYIERLIPKLADFILHLQGLILGCPGWSGFCRMIRICWKIKWRSPHLGVSKNRGTPKSSILIGVSIINHLFWGTPIFGNIHLGSNINTSQFSSFDDMFQLHKCRHYFRVFFAQQIALDPKAHL